MIVIRLNHYNLFGMLLVANSQTNPLAPSTGSNPPNQDNKSLRRLANACG
jgi:hypothetical protein